MASPRYLLALVITINFVALSRAGPLGPLPNVTSADLGLKEGSCALGDVVYMPGDEFPGATPCEKCSCTDGGVLCAKQVCEPRPGCKALHRPDHCCPTYQCECEQEGRVYGNGEKLVDPADPCRVCYCQGGEVVCRRIACFVRDDCTPRLVPGRCCPEYDNCPLRGVTSLPGLSSPVPSTAKGENAESAPTPPKENIKQEITIKEITPVSEIPVITEVKIKEILPSPSIEVAEYSSSKSPLIPREATSEKNVKEADPKTESPSVVEVHLPSPVSSPESIQYTNSEDKDADSHPSKISFSTQDSIHSSIYPSNVPIVATMGIAPVTAEPLPVATTKAPVIEEEDTFDHNPAFPPLPDDLAVLRNHEDEIVPEVVVDNEHVSSHDVLASGASPSTETEVKEPVTTSKVFLDTSTTTTTTEQPRMTTEASTPVPDITVSTISTEAPTFKESPTVNLRSAISTEILNAPSIVSEEINGEAEEKHVVTEGSTLAPTITTEAPKIREIATEKSDTTTEAKETFFKEVHSTSAEVSSTTTEVLPTSTTTKTTPAEVVTTTADSRTTPAEVSSTPMELRTTAADLKAFSAEVRTTPSEITTAEHRTPAAEVQSTNADLSTTDEITTPAPEKSSTTVKLTEPEAEVSTKELEQTTNSIAKSNVATEVTSQTEFSSLPIETSDQNPPEVSEQTTSDKTIISTTDSFVTTKVPLASSEIITLSRAASSENLGFENVETTEFVLTSFGSSETATDAIELIKISASPDKSAAIIEGDGAKKNNVLTDLINLVSDVASISDHTDEPAVTQQATTVTGISESEELIPMNAGYKSKNKNFNQNSITEIPFKNKIPSTVNKQKVVEIEDDESEGVTDSLPPNDKVEPTTRRPIIDNVSDDVNISNNKTSKKDIEIITQSYVPTLHRRPTKMISKKNNEKATAASEEGTVLSTSVETTTTSGASNETPGTTSVESSSSVETSAVVESSMPEEPVAESVDAELSTPPQPSTGPQSDATTERPSKAQ